MSNRDFKIELINAYRKLLEHTLKPVTKTDDVQAQVQEEFKMFVEDRLNDLMGNPSEKEGQLTMDEVTVLKALVANAHKKANVPVDTTRPQSPERSGAKQKTGTTIKKDEDPKSGGGYVPRNLQPAIGNRDTEKAQVKKNVNQDLLSQLDEMDKRFENEF